MEVQNQLFQRGALMSLNISRWGGIKKMSPDDLLLGDIDRDTIYLGHKKLLPRSATERLIELEGKARNYFSAHSLDFPIAGARFVTYGAISEIVARFSSLRTEWDAAVQTLITEYPTFKENQLESLDKQAISLATEKRVMAQAERIDDVRKSRLAQIDAWLESQRTLNRSFYPPIEELGLKFHFQWRIFRINMLDDVSELDPEEIQDAQRKLREDLAMWINTASAQIHKTLGEAAENARSILERNGKLTPRNIKPLFDAFENFMSVDFTGKSTFRETIDAIKSGFLVLNPDGSYSLSDMSNSVNSSEEFTRLLSQISTLAVENIAKEAGAVSVVGTFGRLVDLD